MFDFTTLAFVIFFIYKTVTVADPGSRGVDLIVGGVDSRGGYCSSSGC